MVEINVFNSNELAATAQSAAREAGKYLMKNYLQNAGLADLEATHSGLNLEFKGDVDLVTRCDRESQVIICNFISSHFPEHSILAEEDLEISRTGGVLWVIDPIDGTTNFAHSLPIFAVSIAALHEGRVQAGVIFLPALNEMFHAVRGGGAFLNGRNISVTGNNYLGHSLLATGFPYDRRQKLETYIRPFKEFVKSSRGVRRMGSAAVDMAYTAAGRYDGFWEYGLHAWDTAAGFLLVEEAGGMVTDFSGNPFDPWGKECLASNGKIHEQMLHLLKA